MSSTVYAKRKLYKPIDFFYRGVADAKTKKVAFVDAFQILNDRFLGRMSVCNYFFIAENSVRINELNVIALDELKNYHQVMRENFLIPEKVLYSLPITTRFLENDKEFDVLVATLKDNGYKKGSLIISFNCNTIIRIDDEGKKRYDRLRRLGYLTCVNGFGDEFNSLDIFSKLKFDYLRLEAAYFDSTASKKGVLDMLVKYCKANKISLIMEGVDTPPQYNRFKKAGVKLVTGKAVSKLSRWVTNDFLGLPELTGDKKEAYLKKLNAEIAAQEKKDEAEYEQLRLAAIEKAKADAASGKAMPSAPRPELIKSPYQVRLEQQKETARRAAIAREEQQAARAEERRTARDEYKEKQLISDMSKGIGFDGGAQSAMFGVPGEEGQRANLGNLSVPNKSAKDETSERKGKGKAAEEKAIKAETPEPKEEKGAKSSKKKKDIVADTEREQRLYKEFKGSSLDEQLASDTAMGGFGVNLVVTGADDGEELVGHYNENGQWIDEDGYIYNGFFDEQGDWHDYETFRPEAEGSYNDNGQWVDRDGTVYDGYFDEQGRWINYTYTDADGNVQDNGYCDEKLGKWVPYGYFDESGNWTAYK